MFGLFKKKKTESVFVSFLAFDDLTYANTILEMFANMDSATRAHVLVAYENLLPLLSVMWQLGEEQGEEYTVEQFIPKLAEQLDEIKNDGINSRRHSWFLFAALLARLEKISRNDSVIAEIGAKIWCSIAEDAPILKALLPNNMVWKPEEKEWFDLSMDDEGLVAWTINHAMPPMFSKLDSVRDFAHAKDLFYWPSKSRIGIIP